MRVGMGVCVCVNIWEVYMCYVCTHKSRDFIYIYIHDSCAEVLILNSCGYVIRVGVCVCVCVDICKVCICYVCTHKSRDFIYIYIHDPCAEVLILNTCGYVCVDVYMRYRQVKSLNSRVVSLYTSTYISHMKYTLF